MFVVTFGQVVKHRSFRLGDTGLDFDDSEFHKFLTSCSFDVYNIVKFLVIVNGFCLNMIF